MLASLCRTSILTTPRCLQHKSSQNIGRYRSMATKKATVADIMTKEVFTCTKDMKLSDVLKNMQSNGIQRLPVVDEQGKLIGIVSDRDLRLAAQSPFLGYSPEQEYKDLAKHTVGQCMVTLFQTAHGLFDHQRHSGLVTVDPKDTIVEAAKLMRVRNVGGLPVVDADEHVIGMVTRSDLIDHLIRILEPLDKE